jgi:hypothetical protein
VAAGVLGAGATILTLGSTTVFVPEDLAFMGVSVAELRALNPRLVPLSNRIPVDPESCPERLGDDSGHDHGQGAWHREVTPVRRVFRRWSGRTGEPGGIGVGFR